ncbi:NADH-ubiquinone oxidoreductase kd subunit [Aspergillus californicus]
MASGFGINGGPSRCYNFWQEVLGCYVVNSGEGESGQMKCKPALEDYYECLHHRKEALRTMKMQAAYRKAEASTDREKQPSPEALRTLGLLEQHQTAIKAD